MKIHHKCIIIKREQYNNMNKDDFYNIFWKINRNYKTSRAWFDVTLVRPKSMRSTNTEWRYELRRISRFLAWHYTSTDTGPTFLYGDSDTPPHLVAFYDHAGDTEVHILDLTPRALTGVSHL